VDGTATGAVDNTEGDDVDDGDDGDTAAMATPRSGPQWQPRVCDAPAPQTLDTLPLAVVPDNLPYPLRQVMAQATAKRNGEWTTQGKTLLGTHARLLEEQAALSGASDVVLTYRAWLDVGRKLALVRRAIAQLWAGSQPAAMQHQMQVLATRYVAADDAARYQRQLELSAAERSETRFVPQGPARRAGTGTGLGSGPGSGLSLLDAVPTKAGAVPVAIGSGSGSGPLSSTAAASDLVSAFVNEAAAAFGVVARPVTLSAFDVCPTCHVALRYNQTLQQLLCPVPGCNHWSRFADMTANALAYGEEVEFVKHAYNPATHLDKIMMAAEATESYVVPAEALLRVMQRLYAMGARTTSDISIAKVRQACKDVNVRMDNTVQIFCRIVGRAPRRMTPFMRDQLRIMLSATEGPYRRHAAGRTNHLSFPFSARKDCELLGYWEMVPSFPMLRGNGNVAVHDVITSKVFHDLGWSFTHTLHNHPLLVNDTG
jgi:hypothetical protein